MGWNNAYGISMCLLIKFNTRPNIIIYLYINVFRKDALTFPGAGRNDTTENSIIKYFFLYFSDTTSLVPDFNNINFNSDINVPFI